MKQQILDALKTKFPGVSEATLSRIADKLAKTATTEEQVTTAVEGVTIQQIIDGEADRRATEASQSAVGNYEKKHGLKDGQKAIGGEPAKIEPDDNDTPAWAKALIDSNKELTKKVESMEGEKVANTRKQKLATALEKAPSKIKERYGKDFERMNFGSDDEFESWITEVGADVEAFATEVAAQGAAFKRPIGGGGNPAKEPTKEEVDQVLGKI